MIGRYDYTPLRDHATAEDATPEDRARLADWFQQFGPQYWTGEAYDMDGGKLLAPVYAPDPEDPEEWKITGWEIRDA